MATDNAPINFQQVWSSDNEPVEFQELNVYADGQAAVTLPFPTAEAIGAPGAEATAHVVLPFPTVSAIGQVGNPGTAAVTLPFPIANASEGESFQIIGHVDLPFPTASATGEQRIGGTGAVILPFPTASAIGQQTALAEGMAINRTVTWDEGQTPSMVLGDYFWQNVTLKAGNFDLAYNVEDATSIKVTIVRADHTQALASAVDMASDTEGANWAVGIVSILMNEEQTAQAKSYITREEIGKLEIQVTIDSRTYTWFAPVRLIPGYIS